MYATACGLKLSLSDSEVDIKELQEISNVREELSCLDNVLLREHKIVLPAKLRDKAVSIAHEGHQGMNRTKSFIRSRVWFPRLNEKVEHAVRNCLACQTTHAGPERMEPLNMSEMPGKAWDNLSMDFCGPLPTGEYLLVIIDEYFGYPAVEITKSVSANATVPAVDKVLSMFGYPLVIKTDNGSPFNSHSFAQFASYSGFTHQMDNSTLA